MASLLNKIQNFVMGVADDEDINEYSADENYQNEEYDDNGGDSGYNRVTGLFRSFSSRNSSNSSNYESEYNNTSSYNNRFSGVQGRPSRTNNVIEMRTVVEVTKPKEIEHANQIVHQLRSNRIIVVNLEETDDKEIQRISDFLFGACYAVDGKLRKVSNRIFILVPSTVEINGEFIRDLAEKGYKFNDVAYN